MDELKNEQAHEKPKHFLVENDNFEDLRSAEEMPHDQLEFPEASNTLGVFADLRSQNEERTGFEIDVTPSSPYLKLPDMHSQVDSNGVDCYDYNEDPVDPVTVTPFKEENKMTEIQDPQENKSFNRIFSCNSMSAEIRSLNSTSSGAGAMRKSVSSQDKSFRRSQRAKKHEQYRESQDDQQSFQMHNQDAAMAHVKLIKNNI